MNKVFDDSQIIVKSHGEVIAQKRKSYIVPGELEKIHLSKKILDKASNGEIELSVEEVSKS